MTQGVATKVATPVASRSGFFVLMFLAFLVIALIGFSTTFFLPLARGTFVAPRVTYVHGTILFGWMMFFIAQASLIRVRNVSVHRRLGWLGAALGTAVVISGIAVSLHAAHRDLAVRGDDVVVLRGFVGSLLSFLVFGSVVTAALVLRRESATHKRLLLLATIWILAPAWFRFRHLFPGIANPAVVFTAISYSPLLLAIARDVLIYKRVHPVYMWGGCLFIAYDVMFLFGPQSVWLRVAHWLLG